MNGPSLQLALIRRSLRHCDDCGRARGATQMSRAHTNRCRECNGVRIAAAAKVEERARTHRCILRLEQDIVSLEARIAVLRSKL